MPRIQASPSDGLGQSAHSTPAPHRRFSAVSPRTRQRGTTPFRFPIRVGRSVCCPTMTTDDTIMLVPSFVRIGTSLCPRCFRCVSNSCPNSFHTHAMHVPLNAYSQATQGTRMVHAHLMQTITHGIRTVRASANLQARHWILRFRAVAVERTVLGRRTVMSNLCGWITDRTLYPLSPQGFLLHTISVLCPRNSHRSSEEDSADAHTAGFSHKHVALVGYGVSMIGSTVT